jgi:hypothetical protein
MENSKKPKKKTLGELVLEKQGKEPTAPERAVDIQKAQDQKYTEALIKAIEDGAKRAGDNFFITVLTKPDPHLFKVVKNSMAYVPKSRESQLVPRLDQTLWYVTNKCSDIILLWTLPNELTYNYILANAHQLPPDEHKLLEYCQAFKSGALHKVLDRYREGIINNKDAYYA